MTERERRRELVRRWLALDPDTKLRAAERIGVGAAAVMRAKTALVLEENRVPDPDEAFMREVQARGLIDELALALDDVCEPRPEEDDVPGTKTAVDYTQIPGFERKVVSAVGVKVVDEAKGIAEMYVAGIGNEDDGGDIIDPGWARASLKQRNPKGVWAHDWEVWIAKTVETYEVKAGDDRLVGTKLAKVGAGAQYVKAQFNLDTQAGRDGFSNVKFFGDECEFSIGYVPQKAEPDEKGRRHLKVVDWYEWSPVLFGMNAATSLIGAKDKLAVIMDREGELSDESKAALLEAIMAMETAEPEDKGHTHDSAPDNITPHMTATHGYKAADLPDGTKARHALHVKDGHGGNLANDSEPKAAAPTPEKKSVGELERKQLGGTIEERLSTIDNAVQAWVNENVQAATNDNGDTALYSWTVGTYEASVVACVVDYYATDQAERRRFLEFPYVIGSDGAVALGTPTEVDLVTSVEPKEIERVLAEMKALKAGARHSKTDQEAIQSAHDAIVLAGADCGTADGKGAERPEPEAEPEVEPLAGGDFLTDADRMELDRLSASIG